MKNNFEFLIKEINARIINTNNFQNPVILIGGCSRSGKSKLANDLAEEIRRHNKNVLIVNLDMWLYPASVRKKNSTVLDRYRISELISSIHRIQSGLGARVQPYNTQTRELENFSCIINPPSSEFILILEGVIVLTQYELRKLSSLNIFLDINDQIRLKRLIRFYRDYKSMKKNDYKDLIRQRENEEVILIKKTAIYADIVLKC